MKSRPRKYLIGLGALLLLLLVLCFCGGFRVGSAPARLAVVLVGVEKDPGSHRPRGPTVLHGATGLCAIFAVTNIGKDGSVWFDTCAVERKVGAEWRRTPVPPYASRVTDQLRAGGRPWFLIASDDVNNVYPPGRGWDYVVPWPPEVPTNATWRLELRYGRAPSPFTEKMASAFAFTKRFGFTVFNNRRVEQTVVTPEIRL